MSDFEEIAQDAGMTVVPFSTPDLTNDVSVPSFSTDRLDQGLKILMKSGLAFGYTRDAAGWRFYSK